MNLRSIKINDLESCAGVFAHVFSSEPWCEPWTSEGAYIRLHHFFESKGFYGVLAEDNFGRVVGFVLGNKEPFCDGELYYLREMCVDKDLQKSGIGARLIKFLEEGLISHGVIGAYLATAKGFPAANFYQKNEYGISEGMVFYNKRLSS